MPASSASRSKRSAVSGVSSAGLSTTVLPAASAGRELPRRDRQREVPRRDQPDDAERLAERHRDAAGDRDRVAEVALDAARVVAERLGDHADLAARVADRLAGVARLERRELLEAVLDERGHAQQQPRAVARGDRRPGREAAFARATAASTSSTPARGTVSSTPSVAGSRTCSVSVMAYGDAGPGAGSPPSSASSSEIVWRGPVNVRFALTSHQMPTARNRPPVTSGA